LLASVSTLAAIPAATSRPMCPPTRFGHRDRAARRRAVRHPRDIGGATRRPSEALSQVPASITAFNADPIAAAYSSAHRISPS
jgi:hypothetical protein